MKRVPVADRRGRAAGGQPPKEARASSKDLDYQFQVQRGLRSDPVGHSGGCRLSWRSSRRRPLQP